MKNLFETREYRFNSGELIRRVDVQEIQYHAGWSVSSTRLLDAPVSDSLAGGVVGALHVFLCFFHAAFWHSALQK